MFYFKKNWVPIFFPLHIGISFFTLSIYTWAAGPTTSTKVNIEYFASLKDAKTGKVISSVPETFASTDVMTIYSRDTENPYGNPGLALSPTMNDLAVKLADALYKDAVVHNIPVR